MNTNTLELIFIHRVTLSQVKGKKITRLKKALMGTLRKEVVIGATCWELKSHVFKALVLPTFTYGTKIWGG